MTRARERRGRVEGEERERLRGSFGWELYGGRSARSWTQAQLAQRAGVTETTVRELERGQVRPSDAMCTRLARALEAGRDDLAVAMTDVRLRRAAGASLRVWNRRRPPRLAAQRLYARAEAAVDASRAEQGRATASFLEELDAALAAEPVSAPVWSPAEAWPERWPRVGGRDGA